MGLGPPISNSQSWTSSAAPNLPPASVTIGCESGERHVSQSQVSVSATSGNHTLFISGSGDTVNLSGGTDTITDTGGGNTYVIPAAGNGYDTFTSNALTAGDTLDLRTALAATTWNGSAATLPKYLSVTNSSQGVALGDRADLRRNGRRHSHDRWRDRHHLVQPAGPRLT